MKRMTWAAIVLLWWSSGLADESPYIHKFELWRSQLHSNSEKMVFLTAFTNGYFIGRGEQGMEFYRCLSSNISYPQAVAMIDKYYDANPEKWSSTVGLEILNALTVKDSPCAKFRSEQ